MQGVPRSTLRAAAWPCAPAPRRPHHGSGGGAGRRCPHEEAPPRSRSRSVGHGRRARLPPREPVCPPWAGGEGPTRSGEC